jgi:hypothetical protein
MHDITAVGFRTLKPEQGKPEGSMIICHPLAGSMVWQVPLHWSPVEAAATIIVLIRTTRPVPYVQIDRPQSIVVLGAARQRLFVSLLPCGARSITNFQHQCMRCRFKITTNKDLFMETNLKKLHTLSFLVNCLMLPILVLPNCEVCLFNW